MTDAATTIRGPALESKNGLDSARGDASISAGSVKSLARNRDFLLLAGGQTISRLGDGLFIAALAWTAWRLSHSAASVAIVTVAFTGATFLATLTGAPYADRLDRRRLMITCDLARVGLVAVLAVAQLAGVLTIGGLAVAAALVGGAGGPFAPARNAIVPSIVPPTHLLPANGILQPSFRSAFFVGPLLLAPLTVIAGGVAGAFGVDAVTFALSAASLAALRTRDVQQAGQTTTLRRDLAHALIALRQDPRLPIVIGVFVTAIFFASGFLTVGLTALTADRFGGSAARYGVLVGVAGLAETVAALGFIRIPVRRPALASAAGWVVLGLFRAPLGSTSSFGEALVLLGFTGAASALTDVPLIALAQKSVPSRDLAKILGLWEAGILGASAASAPLAGGLIAGLGVRLGFIVSGALTASTGVIGMLLVSRPWSPAEDGPYPNCDIPDPRSR